MTSLEDAEARIKRELLQRSKCGQSGHVSKVDFVLCEDFESVMIYVDTADELDAACACFDLPDGMPFDPEQLQRQTTLAAERLH
ncbi:hypothetical protein V5279_23895 [Bradyrhizobium sp. 26S5]|uniref:hypothetical protein n=1 Tax=Bradyrhizobium sp. 26S5 TaxID=3139729 RepID=UPI0030D02E33